MREQQLRDGKLADHSALLRRTVVGLILVVSLSASHAQDDPFRPPAVEVEGVAVVRQELVERLRQYQNVRSAGFQGWSPDGKAMLVGTRFGDTVQLHRIFEPGGRREQITFFAEPVEGRFLPQHPGVILASMSAGGSENDQIYRLDADPLQWTLLTDGKSRNLLGPARRDGKEFVYHTNRRNGRDTDIVIADPMRTEPARTILEVHNEHWAATDWSQDGRTLAILRYVSINESYPALLDVETGKRTDIPIPGGAPASVAAMAFSPDGKSLYLACDAQGEFRSLARVDLATQEYTWLTREIPWDVTDVEVDASSGAVALIVNEDGASALYMLDGDKPQRVETPLGVIGGLEFSPDGKSLGFTLAKPEAPADAYSLDIGTRKLTQWTYSEAGGLDARRFVKPERIQFPSFNGRSIPAYYFRPRSATKDKPAPVLINIHGGPEGQYRPIFSEIDQFYLTELGIAVIRPNVRGSSGYGKTYVALDNGLKREDSVQDIGALLDWIANRPELDASRVAVIGGSYGGYMVLASLTHYSDRLKAGVDIVGIASFQSFLETTSAYRQDLRRAEYGDERDPKLREFFAKIDPLHNAKKIQSALLVAHGRNDPRVPFTEAEQIAAAVRANGKNVWTLYADNEGHGFAKKANRDYLTAVITMFLQEHLK